MLARVSKHTCSYFGRESISYDRFWQRRAVFQQTAHFFGRHRNCYKLAYRYNVRALTYTSQGRKYRKKDTVGLWDTRIEGACREFDYDAFFMREALTRVGVYLDRKVLADMALTEPRTFRAITAIAAHKTSQSLEDGGIGQRLSKPGREALSNVKSPL